MPQVHESACSSTHIWSNSGASTPSSRKVTSAISKVLPSLTTTSAAKPGALQSMARIKTINRIDFTQSFPRQNYGHRTRLGKGDGPGLDPARCADLDLAAPTFRSGAARVGMAWLAPAVIETSSTLTSLALAPPAVLD